MLSERMQLVPGEQLEAAAEVLEQPRSWARRTFSAKNKRLERPDAESPSFAMSPSSRRRAASCTSRCCAAALFTSLRNSLRAASAACARSSTKCSSERGWPTPSAGTSVRSLTRAPLCARLLCSGSKLLPPISLPPAALRWNRLAIRSGLQAAA